ncbi:MAG TPA: tetraacyldisaccharide 4'-kinase [Stellaceae bacterium]|nr:tetraacyldisaccharide 4'-kinase [Stellaceae bacterium]
MAPLAAAWEAGGWARRALSHPDRPPVPVVCVGNLVVGGAGKTPVTLALAAHLRALGVAGHVVTRGYGGRLRGPVRVDPARHDAALVGDEPLLLAEQAPTWVARDRAAGARAAAAAGARIVLLDDGLHNPTIAKTLALVVVDAEYGFGNGRVIPAGPLRESPARGLERADAVILLAAAGAAPGPALPSCLRERPVVPALLAAGAGERFAGMRLFAFAGIGRPEKFFAMLERTGAVLTGARAFPDHYRFRAGDLAALRRDAALRGASLITTRKDFVRLSAAERAGIAVFDVAVRWPDPAAPARLLAPVLSEVRL